MTIFLGHNKHQILLLFFALISYCFLSALCDYNQRIIINFSEHCLRNVLKKHKHNKENSRGQLPKAI